MRRSATLARVVRGGVRAAAPALIAAMAAAGCARPAAGPAGPGGTHATLADSVTVALWHLDEVTGSRISDAGPFRLEGTAGQDTRVDFGRERQARVFTESVNSFVIVPYNPVFEQPGAFTVEAWVNPTSYGQIEIAPIAARWTPLANEQSWILGLVGPRPLGDPGANPDLPSHFRDLVLTGSRGQLFFAIQPEGALPPQAWFSIRQVALNRWTHVAATYDGLVVRLYIDGQLDAQFAIQGDIRRSPAPLVLGHFLNPHQLSDFGGDLRLGTADSKAWYAFVGLIDEVRLARAARTRFESVGR